jgi:hypothetical protein
MREDSQKKGAVHHEGTDSINAGETDSRGDVENVVNKETKEVELFDNAVIEKEERVLDIEKQNNHYSSLEVEEL